MKTKGVLACLLAGSLTASAVAQQPSGPPRSPLPPPEPIERIKDNVYKIFGGGGNTPLARAHMNVNVAYTELAGETVGFGIANGAPLPVTAKHKGSNPLDTRPPTPEMLADKVAK